MEHPANVTAIVVTHDSAAKIGACLEALLAAGVTPLVVDNASSDDTLRIAREKGVRAIASPRNEGYGRGNNIGAAAVVTPYLMICNPDVTVEPEAVATLLAAAAAFPEAGVWAPLLIEPDGRRFVQPRSLLAPAHLNAARTVLPPDGPASIPFVSGACFLMRTDLFRRIGGFDPDIFLFYEDDDLCRRLMDRGAAPLMEPRAIVRHQRGGSSAPSVARRFKARWHAAWSERHVRRRYGLPPPAIWPVLWSGFRALLNAVVLRRMQVARYAGTVAGAVGYATGQTARGREGLS
jgi:GT2 family glycosyltransferase